MPENSLQNGASNWDITHQFQESFLINKMLYQSGKGFNHLVEKEEISILVKNFIITAS